MKMSGVEKYLPCLLVFCVAVIMAHDLRLDYQVREGKARFVENIETDLEKNIIKIYTPAHNDVLESYLLQDFQQGKQIRCLPSLRQCRLREIERESPDAGNVTESYIRSWNKGSNSISSDHATVITELYYVGDEITDTVSLGPELRHFYESFGYPLYKEEKIPSDAEILKIDRTNSIKKRVKRAFTPLSSDCNGQTPVRKYGVDTGRSCNYLKICKEVGRIGGRDVFTDCGNVHITSPLAYVCVCCPHVKVINPQGDDCACTKMGG